jgi:hypothetical protein
MSTSHGTSSPAQAESNQFIRPSVLSTSVADFATSKEVAVVIREGATTKLANAVMAALGNCFECLSNEDVCILVDLYTTALSAATTTADTVMEPKGPNILTEQETDTPHSPIEAGGEAARSPTPSVAAAPEEKGAISQRMTCLQTSPLAVMALPFQ